MNNALIKERLIELIKLERNKPIPPIVLINKYQKAYEFIAKKLIYQAIDELINEKKIKVLSDSNKLVLGYINGKIFDDINLKGILSLNTHGDGYIREIDEQKNNYINKDWFVFSTNLCGALDGDIVIFNPMDRFSKNMVQNAVIKKVIERNKNEYVATYIKNNHEEYIQLDNTKNYYKVILDNTHQLVNGNKILINIYKYEENNIARAKLISIIGHVNDIDSDILSIVYDNGIKPNFSSEVNDYVNKIKLSPSNINKHIDICERNYITIDPATSKDLDDAIYVEKIKEDYFLLSVSIADVSSYVQNNSILDECARNRSTSIYLADRVIPMLPHLISNDWCSLNPNEKKYTLTVDMEIDKNGILHKIDVYPSIIVSKKRFSYDEVNDYFNNKKRDEKVNNQIYEMLDIAFTLYQILDKKLINQGYIDFAAKEPVIILDNKNNVIDIKIKEHGYAQKMIENFMISANEAVTVKAKKLKIPFLYRNHLKPSIEKLKKFATEAKKINFVINENDFENLTSKTIAKWIANNPLQDSDLINRLILRCMEKASYEATNRHHFGLALKNYTHFTSPIRRYADLLIHRIYWMYVFNPQDYSDEQRNMLSNHLAEWGAYCTAQEILATKIEREVNAAKFCQYMSQRINQVYDGIISSIVSFGIFVEIIENTIEGLVKINHLGGDFYQYIESNNTIVGKNNNKIFSFGQKVKVKVVSVDLLNKQINLEIIGFENQKNILEPKDFNKKIRAKNNNIKEYRRRY